MANVKPLFCRAPARLTYTPAHTAPSQPLGYTFHLLDCMQKRCQYKNEARAAQSECVTINPAVCVCVAQPQKQFGGQDGITCRQAHPHCPRPLVLPPRACMLMLAQGRRVRKGAGRGGETIVCHALSTPASCCLARQRWQSGAGGGRYRVGASVRRGGVCGDVAAHERLSGSQWTKLSNNKVKQQSASLWLSDTFAA